MQAIPRPCFRIRYCERLGDSIILVPKNFGSRLSAQSPITTLHSHGQGQAREATLINSSPTVTFPHARIHITYEIDYRPQDLIRKLHGISHGACVPNQSGPTYHSKQRLGRPSTRVAPRAALGIRVRALLGFVASQTTVPSSPEHAIRILEVSCDCIMCARSQGLSARNQGQKRVFLISIKYRRSHGVVFWHSYHFRFGQRTAGRSIVLCFTLICTIANSQSRLIETL